MGLFYTLAAAHSISPLDQDTNYDPVTSGELSDTLGHNPPQWITWFCKGWKSSESGVRYSKQQGQDFDSTQQIDKMEQQSTNIFIGDPLEVQIFSKTGF